MNLAIFGGGREKDGFSAFKVKRVIIIRRPLRIATITIMLVTHSLKS